MTSIKPQTVFRVQRAARDFTTISNALLQDARLSHETRGLLCELLSRPTDWEITVRGIIATGPSGREKVYRMIAEAQGLGYISSAGQPRSESGKLGRSYYVVSDAPSPPCAAKPYTAKPDAVEPHAVEPHPANPPQQIKESNKGKTEQITTSAATSAAGLVDDDEGIRGPGFALLWAAVIASAELIGAPADKARQLARVLALEWMGTPPKAGASALAIFRRALREEMAGGRARRPSEARQASAKPHWRDVQRETNDALAGAIARAKAAREPAAA